VLEAALVAALGGFGAISRCRLNQVVVDVEPSQLLHCMQVLKRHDELSFEQLSDLSGVDFLTYGQADWQTRGATNSGFSRAVATGARAQPSDGQGRFAVVYHLLSVKHNWRLRVRTRLNDEPPRVASVCELWPVANWYEREAFDLFGILFDGHPDLRRILTDYGFIGHPFRKDFPLEGYVEVRYDPDKGRVVNQPVSIEPRTLVPRIIREEDWLSSSKPVQGVADA